MVLSDRASERAYFGALARYCDPADIGSIRDAVLAAWDARRAAADREALRHHVGIQLQLGEARRGDARRLYRGAGTPAGTAAGCGRAEGAAWRGLIMDLTTLADHKGRITGIARTELALARELIRHAGCESTFHRLLRLRPPVREIDPIAVMQGQVGSYASWRRATTCRSTCRRRAAAGGWQRLAAERHYHSPSPRWRRRTGSAQCLVHDLIPLLFPTGSPTTTRRASAPTCG
jgi:hypothetical protein